MCSSTDRIVCVSGSRWGVGGMLARGRVWRRVWCVGQGFEMIVGGCRSRVGRNWVLLLGRESGKRLNYSMVVRCVVVRWSVGMRFEGRIGRVELENRLGLWVRDLCSAV